MCKFLEEYIEEHRAVSLVGSEVEYIYIDFKY